MSNYWVYILASDHRTLYTGITGDLDRRLFEHREGLIRGFTWKYNCHSLVYCERHDDPMAAIVREKQIKSWARLKKIALIEKNNPDWRDSSADWGRHPERSEGPRT